jgi:tRNA/tmRNA/rRNA uracil-C5-methylase (TrmA/RlmC/RlmD family)
MANDVTSERLYVLDTASATAIVAAGTPVIVRKVVFIPGAVSDDVVIQEYDSAGAARSAIVLKASPTAAEPTSIDFGPDGRKLNGFILSTKDAGTVYVYLGVD